MRPIFSVPSSLAAQRIRASDPAITLCCWGASIFTPSEINTCLSCFWSTNIRIVWKSYGAFYWAIFTPSDIHVAFYLETFTSSADVRFYLEMFTPSEIGGFLSRKIHTVWHKYVFFCFCFFLSGDILTLSEIAMCLFKSQCSHRLTQTCGFLSRNFTQSETDVCLFRFRYSNCLKRYVRLYQKIFNQFMWNKHCVAFLSKTSHKRE